MVYLRDGCKVVNHKGKVGLEEHGGRIGEDCSGTNALGDGRLDASNKDLEEAEDESGDHEGRPKGPDNGVDGTNEWCKHLGKKQEEAKVGVKQHVGYFGQKGVSHKGNAGLEDHGGRVDDDGGGTYALGKGRLDASNTDLEEVQDESGDHEGRPKGPDNGGAGPNEWSKYLGKNQEDAEVGIKQRVGCLGQKDT